jgi:hypothetical protein
MQHSYWLKACESPDFTARVIYYYYYIIIIVMKLSSLPVAVVLTPVQTEQIRIKQNKEELSHTNKDDTKHIIMKQN